MRMKTENRELSDKELSRVSGGDPKVLATLQDVTANQQKGALKAANQADALIRS